MNPVPLLLLLTLAGCVPGPGALVLHAAEGRVADRESGAPIAGATVIEWWRGAGRGGPQPTYHARFATSDEEGRFVFPRALAPSPRMWLLKTYGPFYGFFHPDYGLVRGGEGPGEGAPILLGGSQAEAELRRADLAPVCRPEPAERWERELARIACPSRPRRPAASRP